MEQKIRSPKDKYILFAFIGFFGLIIIVNSVFIYKAITTQTGLVTDKAYEKGLAYNQTLKEAQSQPQLNDNVIFDGGVLTWQLNIENATATARIIRPIQEGHDFDINLEQISKGVYEAKLDLPFKGLWEAKLNSQWNNQTYKTTHQFIVK